MNQYTDEIDDYNICINLQKHMPFQACPAGTPTYTCDVLVSWVYLGEYIRVSLPTTEKLCKSNSCRTISCSIKNVLTQLHKRSVALAQHLTPYCAENWSHLPKSF